MYIFMRSDSVSDEIILYSRRIAALQERAEHGKTSHSKHPTVTAKGGTKLPTHSRAEQEIEERLRKLKEKPPEQGSQCDDLVYCRFTYLFVDIIILQHQRRMGYTVLPICVCSLQIFFAVSSATTHHRGLKF
jgi:hypothetical protein